MITEDIAFLWAHELLCAALFYSAFCRAVKSDTRVHLDVRLAFNALGAVSCWGFVAPLMGYTPHWFGICLLAAIVTTQWVTAKHWQQGVPDRFMKPEHRPKMRRASDRGVDGGGHRHG